MQQRYAKSLGGLCAWSAKQDAEAHESHAFRPESNFPDHHAFASHRIWRSRFLFKQEFDAFGELDIRITGARQTDAAVVQAHHLRWDVR